MIDQDKERRKTTAELCEIVSAAEDGMLDEKGRARLNELLESSPFARSQYLGLIALWVSLLSSAGRSARREAEMEAIRLAYQIPTVGGRSVRAGAGKSDRRTSLLGRDRSLLKSLVAIATAAVVVVTVGVSLVTDFGSADKQEGPGSSATVRSNGSGTDGQRSFVATVCDASQDVVWTNPNDSFAVEASLSRDQLVRLASGYVEFEYESGVRLKLVGPAEYRIKHEGGVLSQGSLVASVPDGGEGFTVETPNGKVVDLGTEFGVVVDDFGYSEVGVFKGKVEAYPKPLGGRRNGASTPAERVELNAGDGLLWTDSSLARIETNIRRFAAGTLPASFQSSGGAIATWRELGAVEADESGFTLRGRDESPRSFLLSKQSYDPTNGPITVECEMVVQDTSATGSTVAILTRSDERRGGAPAPWQDMIASCVRCGFGPAVDSRDGMLHVATKHESGWAPIDLSWRGFQRPIVGERYHLSMTDDGVNVTFTVSRAANPSVSKTVTCRSLFRGIGNYVAIEGPQSGAVRIDKIRIAQETRALTRSSLEGDDADANHWESQLDSLVPPRAKLLIKDSFRDGQLDQDLWTTLGEAEVQGGHLKLGDAVDGSTIDTWRERPYLLSRETFSTDGGPLIIIGKIRFSSNHLAGYGGSFAVMTRASNEYRSGEGWERSLLSYGVRANLWPAGLGIGHSLELHEVSPKAPARLLAADAYEVSPEARDYLFKVVDDGKSVELTVVDAEEPAKRGFLDHRVRSNTAAPLHLGFESTWGCPVEFDEVRVYRGAGVDK